MYPESSRSPAPSQPFRPRVPSPPSGFGVIGPDEQATEGASNARTKRWGVVLAGGSGCRLNELTTDAAGTVIPKQYCSFLGGPSLMRKTIRRLSTVVDPNRIVVVVSAKHRRWWEPELSDISPENLLVQPCDRGTACGVLLPLKSILSRDQTARIVVSPSDHFYQDESTFTSSLLTAQQYVDEHPKFLVLLGMEPDDPDAGYGWISPSPGDEDAIRGIRGFVEKPDSGSAKELMRSGALWSSFTFVAAGTTLMGLFRRYMPWLVDKFNRSLAFVTGTGQRHAILSLYDRLPTVDFSKSLLEQAREGVHVLPVPPCGWTDLGTPQRVSKCAMKFGGPDRGSEWKIPTHEESQTSPEQAPAFTFRRCPIDLADVALR
jgi:mannose-1-phosphate guanylyltransferase